MEILNIQEIHKTNRLSMIRTMILLVLQKYKQQHQQSCYYMIKERLS